MIGRGRAGLAVLALLTTGARAVEPDQEVRFFPSYVFQAQDGWRARVMGWVFEPERDSAVRAKVIKDLERYAPPDADRALFNERAWAFFADAEEGEPVELLIDGREAGRPRSGDEGELSWETPLAAAPRAGQTLPVETAPRPGDGRVFKGQLAVLAAEGLSVVSDVDDTIRISSVTDRRALYAGTFFHPWRAVPGMAALYKGWLRSGAAFHYLSNSPAPLLGPMGEFLSAEGFPAGSLHLRPFSVRRTLWGSLFSHRGRHKRETLDRLLADFPKRRFILVGDSAERDPEIYGDAARRHPGQVSRIFIRDVTGEGSGDARYAQAFRELPDSAWRLFADPKELIGGKP